MKRTIFLSFFLLVILSSCEKFKITRFRSDWQKLPDGVWVGPDLWANRLQDWSVSSGKIECQSTLPMRTVHLVTRSIPDRKGKIKCSVNIYRAGGENNGNEASAGILVGAGGGLNYLSASLIFHSWGESAGIYIGLDGNGNLFIRDFEKEDSFFTCNKINNIQWSEAQLFLKISPVSDHYSIKVIAVNPVTNEIIDRIEAVDVPGHRIRGNIALVSHAGYRQLNGPRFAFSEWKVSGSKIQKNSERNIGPVLTAQYTLSGSTLKLSAQMMPVAERDGKTLILQLHQNGKWINADTAEIQKPSYTALFRINNWNRTEDTDYRLLYRLKRKTHRQYYLTGIIKHNPADKAELKMLSLSCIEQIIKPDRANCKGIDGGYFPYNLDILYPHAKLVQNLKKCNADILFFAGDQVYEGASPTLPDTSDKVMLDYLYKWYLWCLTFRELTTCIPAITIPDDHDVYQGNLWGAGGKATPARTSGTAAQDAGGYKMSPEFVNMVQTTQTSHLPDPVDPAPAEQGINVYFTECNIGGLSLAVIEDRKFKSAPRGLLPEADIYNGWPQNRFWNTRYNSRIENAALLGDRQLSFLDKWAADWSDRTWMKAVLSQTLFANLATIPRYSMDDSVVPIMEIPDSGAYISGEKLATDFDSDGWPQNERDKAIRIFRKAFAIHIAGDQHLGSTVQYGIDEFCDAGFAIISPATGNIWPRHWFPPYNGGNRKAGWPGNYGDFEDGFGNKMTVYAVANPHKTVVEPIRNNELSAGFSVITFNRQTRDIELSNWPYYADPQNDSPFPFWPVKINQLDNYGKSAAGWLPEIKVEGLINPVIKIFREWTGELIYSLRISGQNFQPKVFEMGNYRIEVGEPDENKWQKLEKVYPTTFKEREPVTFIF